MSNKTFGIVVTDLIDAKAINKQASAFALPIVAFCASDDIPEDMYLTSWPKGFDRPSHLINYADGVHRSQDAKVEKRPNNELVNLLRVVVGYMGEVT